MDEELVAGMPFLMLYITSDLMFSEFFGSAFHLTY